MVLKDLLGDQQATLCSPMLTSSGIWHLQTLGPTSIGPLTVRFFREIDKGNIRVASDRNVGRIKGLSCMKLCMSEIFALD